MSKVSKDEPPEGEDKRKLLHGLGHALYLTTVRKHGGFTSTLELLDEEKNESVFKLEGTGGSEDEGLKVSLKMSEEEMLRLFIRLLEAMGAKKE